MHEEEKNLYAQVVRARRSCRAFLPDEISKEALTEIFTTAQHTASWNNVQVWQATVLTGRAKDRLSAMLIDLAMSQAPASHHFEWPTSYDGIYKERRRACGFQLYDAVGIEKGDKAAYAKQSLKNFEFFGAPHVAIITSDASIGTYGLLDCGAYIANLMQAAASQGVATIAQAALTLYCDEIHTHLDLPETRRVVCGVAFGIADDTHPINQYRVPRAPVGDVVRWIDT